MSSNRMADGFARCGEAASISPLQVGRDQGNSVWGRRRPAARRKLRREPLGLEAGSTEEGKTKNFASTIPPSTTELSNKIKTAKLDPLRRHSLIKTNRLKKKKIIAAILRAAMIHRSSNHVDVGYDRDTWFYDTPGLIRCDG